MSMALHSLPEVYHSSWVEMRSGIAMRYELDHDNGLATLYFGHRDDYVLTLGRENLDRLLDLGAAARREFTSARRR
jgi:hypothetical protein